MAPATPNEKLNFVLDQIKHERSYNDLYREINENANMKGQFGNDEINLIMDKLREDGYIDYVAGQKINKDMRASDGLNMRRNFNGTVFITNGGYVEQARVNNLNNTIQENRNANAIFFQRWIWVATSIMAVYYLIEMLKYFHVLPQSLSYSCL